MRKTTKEQREKCLEMYKQGYKSYTISNEIGLNRKTVQNVLRSFDVGDFSWLEDSARCNSKLTDEEKLLLVLEAKFGERNKFELAKDVAISERTLQRWITTYNKLGVSDDRGKKYYKKFKSRDFETEKIVGNRGKKNGTLLGRFSYLCEVRNKPCKKEILRGIREWRESGGTLKDALAQIRLKQSTYYYWKKHEKDVSEKDEILAKQIKELQEKNYWSLGAKSMAKELVKAGFYEKINHKRVSRVMDEYNLHARVKIRKYPKNYYKAKAENAKELPANELGREFEVSEKMKKLVTDITYLKTKDGWLYFAAIMDLYNREIIAYRIGKILNLDLSVGLIEDLRKEFNLCGVMIHSDMGWTYTNKRYVELLKKIGVKQSMSRKGNCWDNACIESFFGTFKSATIKQLPPSKLLSANEMIKLVENFVEWYNKTKSQKRLGYLSPVEYRKKNSFWMKPLNARKLYYQNF